MLDTFAGAGTTLVAAKALGGRCIEIEANTDYCEVPPTRLAREALL